MDNNVVWGTALIIDENELLRGREEFQNTNIIVSRLHENKDFFNPPFKDSENMVYFVTKDKFDSSFLWYYVFNTQYNIIYFMRNR